MAGLLLDDLGRVLATPMPRARVLRLIGATLFCAIFPRRPAAAGACGTCAGSAPVLCCLVPPWNPNSALTACCTTDEFCCADVTPDGGAWASRTCCSLSEQCSKDSNGVMCVPCPEPLCGG